MDISFHRAHPKGLILSLPEIRCDLNELLAHYSIRNVTHVELFGVAGPRVYNAQDHSEHYIVLLKTARNGVVQIPGSPYFYVQAFDGSFLFINRNTPYQPNEIRLN